MANRAFALSLLLLSAAAHGEVPVTSAEVSTPDETAKLAEALVAKKKWRASLDRRIGKEPTPVVSLYNTHTREFVVVNEERPAQLSSAQVNRFFRCHFTNQATGMDKKLFPALVAAAKHFEVGRINIVSGYRSPKYNLILIKKGREVARRSQHVKGNAIDFRMPGVPTLKLQQWAKSKKLGGVGYYPGSRFIHLDTWKVRYWQAN